jgi:uncharacterized repeat protein (TIGR01451 family)
LKGINKCLMLSFFILAIFGSGIASVSAATVTVNSGLNNTQIQAIIDGSNSGDTIQFLGSEYDNIALVINKTLNLVGANSGTIIKAISNSSYIPQVVTDNAITNTAAFYFFNGTNGAGNGSSISGFNITSMANSTTGMGYDNSLIYSQYVSGLNITNNSLNLASWGIYAVECPNLLVSNNSVVNMATTGILSFGSANAIISNNSVQNCSNHGIDVRHPVGPNVTVSGNFVNNCNEGIYLMHSQGHSVYNNTIKNCKLSSITVYGAGNVNITNNTMSNSFVGVLLSSGFYNVNIQNNTYNLTSTMFPPTFPYYILIADSSTNSKTSANGTFSDSADQYSNISLSSTYSNSSITNGKTTTLTIKVSNNGQSSANNLNITNLLPSSNYTNYQIGAVSRGTFNTSTGTWNLNTLSANSEAIIVFTLTAKHAGTLSTSPSVNYMDNNGKNTINASNSNLNIKKNIVLSNSNSVSSSSIKVGKVVTLASKISNSGLDTSDNITVKMTLSNGMKLVSKNNLQNYNKKTNTWTFKMAAGKSFTFKTTAKITTKGNHKVIFNINGKTTTKTIKGT